MRVVVSDYEGPLVRLRRANDNAVLDFGWADNDILDIAAINAWRGVNNVYMVIWYDQSGLGRNAVQNTIANQPQFFPNALLPYFQGDGVTNRYLTVSTTNGIQSVTNAGNQGSVIGVMLATNKNQHSFGVLTGGNRWSSHINWSDGRLYFDPGLCCDANRSVNNAANVNVWKQYTFIKNSTNIIIRISGTELLNGINTSSRCTSTDNFAIGWATGNESIISTTAFNEFIMYNIDIPSTLVTNIEQDAITFWGI
jgi:hypothetical protein